MPNTTISTSSAAAGNLFDRPPHEADIAEQLDHEIDGGGLRFNTFSPNYKHRWEIFASGQGIRRASYYGAQKNPDAYGHTNDKTFAIGTQYTYTMDRLWFMPAELTAGIEYNYNDLHDYYMSLDRDFTQQTHVTGGYLQNEWKTEKLSLLVGARLDKHNLMEHVVLCPRANHPVTVPASRSDCGSVIRAATAPRRPTTKTCTSKPWGERSR